MSYLQSDAERRDRSRIPIFRPDARHLPRKRARVSYSKFYRYAVFSKKLHKRLYNSLIILFYFIDDIHVRRRSLEKFSAAHLVAVQSVDPDHDCGELMITLPQHVVGTLVAPDKTFDISVEYSIEQPAGGLHFVIPDEEGSLAEVSFDFQVQVEMRW